MFRFENIHYLYGLLLIPIIILTALLIRRWRKRTIASFADANLVNALVPDLSKFKPALKVTFLCLAFFFLIIGLANPQNGSKLEEIKREGVDLIIALDISNSMRAEDLSPNRLENAKLAISRLIENLRDDRIGVVIFAGQAYVQLPVTTDYAAAKLFLDNISTDMIPTQGTAIGNAIELAVNSFDPKSGNSKAIIVITDGENHEDDAIKAAEAAAEKGIAVHTIGMGSPNGAPIPLYQNGHQTGFRKDNSGTTVITRLDENNLQQIASMGHGIYVRATNSQAGLSIIFDQINKMQKKEFGSKVYTDYDDHFQIFLFLAILFFMIELLISETVSKWWLKLDLFGKNKNTNSIN
ncbi:MAG: VWA domain-containing protein [Bacteroidetes bacterium]|nr:VWA domain-containing protein [Bacteroidota bacterium]